MLWREKFDDCASDGAGRANNDDFHIGLHLIELMSFMRSRDVLTTKLRPVACEGARSAKCSGPQRGSRQAAQHYLCGGNRAGSVSESPWPSSGSAVSTDVSRRYRIFERSRDAPTRFRFLQRGYPASTGAIKVG